MIELKVDGMTCDGCARAVEKIVKARDPSARVTVDFQTGKLQAATILSDSAIIEAIGASGYSAKPI